MAFPPQINYCILIFRLVPDDFEAQLNPNLLYRFFDYKTCESDMQKRNCLNTFLVTKERHSVLVAKSALETLLFTESAFYSKSARPAGKD